MILVKILYFWFWRVNIMMPQNIYGITMISKKKKKIGFSTRIFTFIIEGDITASKGRESLAKQAVEAIIENPMWGYGITADRAMFGIYPHNMFLEILCQYGIVFGSLLIITMLVITVIALLKSRKNRQLCRRFSKRPNILYYLLFWLLLFWSFLLCSFLFWLLF